MKANNPGLKLLPVLAMLLSGSALADGAVDIAPAVASSKSELAAVTADEVPQVSAGKPGQPGSPLWPVGALPMPIPGMQPMPHVAGLAGKVLLMPVWMQPMPGMPPVLNWFPVMLAPVPALAAMPSAPADSVDYGPLSDAPVIELPLPDEVNSQSIEEPGAMNVPQSQLRAAGTSTAAEPPSVTAPAVASAASAPEDPPWSAPTVDYGPSIDAPVVDMLALEKKLFAPAVQPRKPMGPSVPAAAKPVPKKARMCWKNGVVAPCK